MLLLVLLLAPLPSCRRRNHRGRSYMFGATGGFAPSFSTHVAHHIEWTEIGTQQCCKVCGAVFFRSNTVLPVWRYGTGRVTGRIHQGARCDGHGDSHSRAKRQTIVDHAALPNCVCQWKRHQYVEQRLTPPPHMWWCTTTVLLPRRAVNKRAATKQKQHHQQQQQQQQQRTGRK